MLFKQIRVSEKYEAFIREIVSRQNGSRYGKSSRLHRDGLPTHSGDIYVELPYLNGSYASVTFILYGHRLSLASAKKKK